MICIHISTLCNMLTAILALSLKTSCITSNDLSHNLVKTLQKVCTCFSALIIVCSLIASNSWMNNDMVNALTPHLIGKRPNTYTFTKSLAEHVLLQEADNFPIAIFRPSIIGAAWKEPFEVSTLVFHLHVFIVAGHFSLCHSVCHTDYM